MSNYKPCSSIYSNGSYQFPQKMNMWKEIKVEIKKNVKFSHNFQLSISWLYLQQLVLIQIKENNAFKMLVLL